MPDVADLLRASPQLGLKILAGPESGRLVREVGMAQALSDVASAGEGTLLVVMQAASAAAPPYELDVAIRQAADHRLAAVVFAGLSRLPVTALRLADRAGVTVLTSSPAQDITELVLGLDRSIHGGAAETITRAQRALARTQKLERAGDVERLLAAVAEELGSELVVTEVTGAPEAADPLGAVYVWGRVVGTVQVDRNDEASRLVLPSVAAAVSRIREAEIERRFAPAQTRAELLAQILVAERSQLGVLAERARHLNLWVDGTHVAAIIRPRVQDQGSNQGFLRQRRLLDAAELMALQNVRNKRGQWHVVRLAEHLLVLCTERSEQGGLLELVRTEVRAVVDLLGRSEQVALSAGIGTPQRGPEGIRQSATEASAAAESAEAGKRGGVVAEFDAVGIHRILADLYSSPLSRGLIAELLAPLDALGLTESRRAIETLSAYFDALGSPTGAAKILHLHPNAVRYRVRRAVSALGIDLADPDTCFALHIACRLRLLDR